MYDFIFFDLDGTLTDPAEGITNSFKYAFKHFGLEIPPYETLLSFIGPTLPFTFKELVHLPDDKIDEAVATYREYFGVTGLFENKVYPGIPELLQKLKDEGRHLVVATSKPEHFSKRIMERFDLAKYFDYICGSNMDESRGNKAEVIKYALECCGLTQKDKDRIIMIGDRYHDIEGAKQNGLKCASVLYGFGNREEFEKYGADYIVNTVNDIYAIL